MNHDQPWLVDVTVDIHWIVSVQEAFRFLQPNRCWTQVQGHHERHLLIQPVAKAKPKFKINCTSWAPFSNFHPQPSCRHELSGNKPSSSQGSIVHSWLTALQFYVNLLPSADFPELFVIDCVGGLRSLIPRSPCSPRPKSFLRKRILKMARKLMNQWCLV